MDNCNTYLVDRYNSRTRQMNEIEYYIESIIKLCYTASTLKHKQEFEQSNYLHNEYSKCISKINRLKYKLIKKYKDLLLTIDANNYKT